MIRWFFIIHIIVYEKIGVSEAFKKSNQIITGIFWNVFAIMIINAIIGSIAGVVGFGILAIVTTPYTNLVIAKYYLENFFLLQFH